MFPSVLQVQLPVRRPEVVVVDGGEGGVAQLGEDPLRVDPWTFGHSSAPLALPLYRVQQAVFFQRQLLILNTSILLYKKRAHDEQ